VVAHGNESSKFHGGNYTELPSEKETIILLVTASKSCWIFGITSIFCFLVANIPIAKDWPMFQH
jgi:hypothetical protein